jgi:hypothetical protein
MHRRLKRHYSQARLTDLDSTQGLAGRHRLRMSPGFFEALEPNLHASPNSQKQKPKTSKIDGGLSLCCLPSRSI